MEAIAKKARKAAQALAAMPVDLRNRALHDIGQALIGQKEEILKANALDCAQCDPSTPLYKRLKLADDKFASLVEGCDQVVGLPDPVGVVSLKRELTDGLVLTRKSCPIGVLAIIYEARPEAGVQIVTLALKSGNALILKGGKEAVHSNHAIFVAIDAALTQAHKEYGFPLHTVQIVDTRDEVSELLKLDKYIDLVIPRGSNQLVRSVQNQTKIPVLGHADGICMIYVDDECGDLDRATRIITDAKTNYPAACNAVEILLVNKKVAESLLPKLAEATASYPVRFKADQEALKYLPQDRSVQAEECDFRTEFLDYVVAVKCVDSIDEAIGHINDNGSHHTDCIITENKDKASLFEKRVDSAGCYVNCSTRFADGFRYGFGAEVGISTSRIHSRGPVGVEGLVLYKYTLVGDGHLVGEMGKSRQFNYRDLE
eukprot:Protomagalhaensia_sp_Gyna_25__1286@NODE_1645_length_1663_cov_203_121305_g1344_i0_p1_GENE_NODE_1645_length_1663_cov_203_121305_g1344_i0NODE_1645_length_1663_cov_203_121305_g1344_i0_p1_ORF_typecomplete_len429_score94_36Aldedh/PF00171_22/1_4e67Phytaselike/PF13449_6/0_18_NODE_1645_length_1663_cov_203_121305_g1344_i0981384